MDSLNDTFTALGDSTRRAILTRLTTGEATFSDLASPFDMSQTAVSKHIKVLNKAGLVEVSKRGRTRYCRLSAVPIKEAADWLNNYEAFWQQSFQSLAHFVEEEQ